MKVTDLTSAPDIKRSHIFHIVDVTDTTDDPAGSSFFLDLGQMFDYINSASVVVPTGTDQSDALELSDYDNAIDVVAAGSGVKLQSLLKNYRVKIRNYSSDDLLIYPAVGGNFKGMTTNAPITLSGPGIIEIVNFEENESRYE